MRDMGAANWLDGGIRAAIDGRDGCMLDLACFDGRAALEKADFAGFETKIARCNVVEDLAQLVLGHQREAIVLHGIDRVS